MRGSPKALLSDFGTSEEMLKGRRERTGHTGTMEYMVGGRLQGKREVPLTDLYRPRRRW